VASPQNVDIENILKLGVFRPSMVRQ